MRGKKIPDAVLKTYRIVFPKKLLRGMDELVKRGAYHSYAEIIREGVALVMQKHGIKEEGGGRSYEL